LNLPSAISPDRTVMTEISLLEKYEILLKEYDRVLSISGAILDMLKKQEEDSRIVELLEQKRITAEKIMDLTRKISAIKLKVRKDQNLRSLSEIKVILSRIDKKAQQIRKIEEETQNLL
jgi:hypothetical protein